MKRGVFRMKVTVDGKMTTLKDAPVSTLEERIQRLEDRAAIEECMMHYMRCCDNFDTVGMASCFSKDGKLSWGDIYPSVVTGREAILEHLQGLFGAARTQSHFCTNQQIYFESKDSAIVHCYMYSWQTWKDTAKEATYCYGRYETQVVREEDGEWRFASFKLVMAGQVGGVRTEEQFNRPWPPVPIGR